ncbi:SDR family oxidoreductase [Rubrimonas cliftonensis]|uniref:NADP-dependent 3-hydroxy acid dehydrogenase YdfG n=1 Tax=Rubrimonas cliftonensis TaxID=89524 RepID=A0A1H3XKE1_9RHOB|nr:SDR family oxidoreductase [Rubrimonas cliftonensis]SDZ99793.1 NADP-dependent 3-hydroxy acid dehydrogenase YdfG [Rubrimonas cliftonensis]
MTRHGRLTGKIAAVTGAASGIGAATARLMAEEGAALLLADRDAEGLAALAAAWPPGAPAPLVHVCDVTDETAAEAAVARAAEAHGAGPDILVAAAGWSTGRRAGDETLADFRAVLDANLIGAFLWSRATLPGMCARGAGSIVLIGSQLATAGGVSNAAYVASKGAVAALARSMALDYAAEGVRVNVLAPGAVETPLLARSFARSGDPEAARRRCAGRHAMGRIGRPEEIARAAVFLASDDAAFTTGATLHADGGWLVA